jgi:FixJ family two-component response regulator
MDRNPPITVVSPQQTHQDRKDALTCQDHMVLVLDDDPSIRSSLQRLLTSHGFSTRLHATPEDFFNAGLPAVPACLLLDNQLGNDITGVEVHAELQRRGWDLPTVFVTAHWNVRAVVSAIRAGADGYITKPYDPAELVETVTQALERARAQWHNGVQITSARVKAATLTAREREIVTLVLRGALNKEIADQLNIALVTVKVHRGRAMRKFGAGNAAELAHLAALAGLDT